MKLKTTFIIIIFTTLTLTTVQVFSQSDSCDSSYPDVCIPPYPPDLNCNDISDKNFRVFVSRSA